MIKALFFDIDGTLVSFKTHTIPDSTIQALTAAKSKGIEIYISTGRPYPLINNISVFLRAKIIEIPKNVSINHRSYPIILIKSQ